jgi:8-oxo-dGTP diphosphatase
MTINNKFDNSIFHSLSIDCVIFGFHESKLHLLLVQHKEGISKGLWGVPGGFVRMNESLDDGAYRLLKDLTGVKDIFLEQLKAFGDVNRFPGERVVTVAYYSLIKEEDYNIIPGFTASDAKWVPVNNLPELIYDHREIISFGREYLQHKVKHEPIGFNLLPQKFTLLQLQELYETLLDTKLDKPNFRRKILNMNLLVDLKEKQKNVSHRAANLYRFDQQVYLDLKKKGFVFEY